MMPNKGQKHRIESIVKMCESKKGRNHPMYGKYPERIIKDEKVNNTLKKQGYKIIRIWEHEINNDIMKCLDKIRGTVP